MITRNQAMTANEFHEHQDGLPCLIWRRLGETLPVSADGFYAPIERRNAEGYLETWFLTGVTATAFHVPADCPRSQPGEVPGAGNIDGQLTLNAGYGTDGYDTFGYDADGYNRDGYSAAGYDRDGYDREGYDEDGDDRYGRNRTPDASDLDLAELWGAFQPPRYSTAQDDFAEHLRTLVRDPDEIDDLGWCDNCAHPEWESGLRSAENGSSDICEACWDDWYSCDSCDGRFPSDGVNGMLNGNTVCDRCRDRYYSWCEDCDGYYEDEDADYHDHDESDDGCCESPQQEFTIRNGDGWLANDTRVTIELPAGTISTDGLAEISRYLRYYGGAGEYRALSYYLDALGDQWQTREGNYAKRLSRLAYQRFQLKLPAEAMSHVGQLAREHSTGADVAIEVTRDLNMSAADFYHEDSCWWADYRESRCALKTNGGLGLRSFSSDSYGHVTGRAWVMPLRKTEQGNLTPTFSTGTPDAFVVFNGYGDLSGYAPARVMAQMTGWTYRKIGFSCSPMYVNSGGYLIAPEDITAQYADRDLNLYVDRHASLYAAEQGREPAYA